MIWVLPCSRHFSNCEKSIMFGHFSCCQGFQLIHHQLATVPRLVWLNVLFQLEFPFLDLAEVAVHLDKYQLVTFNCYLTFIYCLGHLHTFHLCLDICHAQISAAPLLKANCMPDHWFFKSNIRIWVFHWINQSQMHFVSNFMPTEFCGSLQTTPTSFNVKMRGPLWSTNIKSSNQVIIINDPSQNWVSKWANEFLP